MKPDSAIIDSEERFRFLADAIPHKMWISGPDGHANYYNKGWYDYTGTKTLEEIRAKVWSIIDPDDLEMAEHEWSRAIEQGTDLELEHRLMNLGGEYIWHLTCAYVHKDETGKPIMWIGTSTNIHKQKQALEALKASEEHFKALTNNNSLIIWQADENGAIIYVNDTWKARTGLDMGPQLKDQILAAVYPDDVQGVVEKLGAEFQARIPMQTKFRFKLASGQYHWVLVYANPLFKPEFGGYIGSMIDIDEQERSQKATRMLLQKRDEFLGIASHELKTPITSMKASLQILERLSGTNFDPSQIRPFIAMASKQVKKLTEIIDDLLDVTRIQSGKMPLNCTEYVFYDSVQECINEIMAYTPKHQIVVEKNYPALIYADRTRIEQVMVNLINNAIKYSPDAEKVVINIEKIGPDLRFSVTDFGIGIPEDKQSQIFDRFFRVHESSQNYSGLGLGLYISAEIINRHNGRVGMESDEGKGSTFWFSLPLVTDYQVEQL